MNTTIIKQAHKGITFLSAVTHDTTGLSEVAIFRTDISGDQGVIWGTYETPEEAESTINWLSRKSDDRLAEIHAELAIASRYAFDDVDEDDTEYYSPVTESITFQIIEMG